MSRMETPRAAMAREPSGARWAEPTPSGALVEGEELSGVDVEGEEAGDGAAPTAGEEEVAAIGEPADGAELIEVLDAAGLAGGIRKDPEFGAGAESEALLVGGEGEELDLAGAEAFEVVGEGLGRGAGRGATGETVALFGAIGEEELAAIGERTAVSTLSRMSWGVPPAAPMA
jgi:hypothetical protein